MIADPFDTEPTGMFKTQRAASRTTTSASSRNGSEHDAAKRYFHGTGRVTKLPAAPRSLFAPPF
jgi:hypothetical protein